MERTFGDATLVLVGHGSSVDADSAAPIRQHASELRRRGLFADVREAFWKQEPRLSSLPEFGTPRVFFAPMFISEGYFCERLVPGELGFAAGDCPGFRRLRMAGEQKQYYCRPIGTHGSMTGVILQRARDVLARFPFPTAPRPEAVTLFIAGHGTEQDENSRKAIDAQVESIARAGVFAAVRGAFMDQAPRISECYDLASTRCIVVVPFFMSDGMHVKADIPVMLGEPERLVEQRLKSAQPAWRNPTERRGKMVWYSPSVGTEPKIAEIVLQRVAEAAQWG